MTHILLRDDLRRLNQGRVDEHMAEDQKSPGETIVHQLRNYLSILIGFCDLLLHELSEDDPKYADTLEMKKAAVSAMELVPELSRRLQ